MRKPIPLCQLTSVKPTGEIPSLSTSGDSGRGKTAYHYYRLLPYLSLQVVVVDLGVTVLLMNHVAVNQYYRISLLPYALNKTKMEGITQGKRCLKTINS